MKNVKYPNLMAELVRHGEKGTDLARMLGVKYEAVRRRMNGSTEWTISEIDFICEHYNKSYEELFKKEVD